MRQLLLFLCAFAIIAMSHIAYAQSSYQQFQFWNLIEHDERLARIGYRLSKANAQYCSNVAPKLGWVLHDIGQYPDREEAQAVFLFQSPISILVVVKDTPADRAGVKEGDGFIAISYKDADDDDMIRSRPIPVSNKRNDYSRMATVNGNIKELLSGMSGDSDSAKIIIKRNGKEMALPFNINKICASEYILDARSKIDAGANGHHVRITLGLSEFLTDDDEYAAAVAHELAHNILGHRRMIADGKAGKGPLAGLGRNKRIRVSEEQADRLAVWLMANAGFDVEAGPRMIERLNNRKGRPLFGYRTHNKRKKRLDFMNQEIATLRDIMPDAQGRRVPPLINALITK